MVAMWACVTSLNSQKNTLFKNIKFDSPCHLKKNQVSFASSKQMTLENLKILR
jgi:hypothetical protein